MTQIEGYLKQWVFIIPNKLIFKKNLPNFLHYKNRAFDVLPLLTTMARHWFGGSFLYIQCKKVLISSCKIHLFDIRRNDDEIFKMENMVWQTYVIDFKPSKTTIGNFIWLSLLPFFFLWVGVNATLRSYPTL